MIHVFLFNCQIKYFIQQFLLEINTRFHLIPIESSHTLISVFTRNLTRFLHSGDGVCKRKLFLYDIVDKNIDPVYLSDRYEKI